MSDFTHLLRVLVEVGGVEPAKPPEPDPNAEPAAPAGGEAALATTDPHTVLEGYIREHQSLAETFDRTVVAAFQTAEKTLGTLGIYKYVAGEKSLLPPGATMAQAGPLRNREIPALSSGLQSKLASLQQRATAQPAPKTPPKTMRKESHDFSDLLNVILEATPPPDPAALAAATGAAPTSPALAGIGKGTKPDVSATASGVSPESNKAIGTDYDKAKQAISTLLGSVRTAYNAYKDGSEALLRDLRAKLPEIRAGHEFGKFAHGQVGRLGKRIESLEEAWRKQREAYEEEVKSYKEINKSLTDQLEQVRADLARSRELWKQDVTQTTAEREAKAAEVREKHQRIQELETDLAQRQTEINAKQREVDAAKQEVDRNREEVQAAAEVNQINAGLIKDYQDSIKQFVTEFNALAELTGQFRDEADMMRERIMTIGGYSKQEPPAEAAPKAAPAPKTMRKESYHPYGSLNLREHLAKASRKTKKMYGDW